METTTHDGGKEFPLGTILLVISGFSFPMLLERSKALEELLSFMLDRPVNVNVEDFRQAKEVCVKGLLRQIPSLNTEELGKSITKIEPWLQGRSTDRIRDEAFSRWVADLIPAHGETILVHQIQKKFLADAM